MNNDTKILIVEDEKLIGMDVRENLAEMGYTVTGIVDSCESTIDSINLYKPDLVIMDIVINGDLDGIETADIVRKKFSIPVIFTSANNDDYTLLKAKKVQPYSFLTKPVNPRELCIAIEIAVYKNRMEDELRQSREWFESTLKSISDGIIAVNNKGVVTFINQSAEILTGLNNGEALGKDLIDVLKFKDFEGNYSGVTDFGSVKFLNSHSILNQKTGETHRVQTNDSVIKDKNGNNLGMVVVIRKEKIEQNLSAGGLALVNS